MKILFLNIYSGINRRGAESFTNELANRLGRNNSVTLFQAGNQSSKQTVEIKTFNMNVQQPQETLPDSRIGKVQKRLFLDSANRSVLLFTLKTIPLILRSAFELLIPINGFWQLLLLKLFQPFKRYKILVIGNSGPGWDERFNLYLKPDVFVATTEPSAAWAKKIAPWTSVEYIPYAIDKNIFSDAEKVNLNLSEPIILCPSALVTYKRVELAIKAVAHLNRGSLLVLGQGPLKEDLEKKGKQLLGKRFRLMSVPYNEMPKYYKACQLVTLPSSPQENSPMVFLESLAAGKLVVTTDNPRSRWMLEGAGFYCNPEDVDDYALSIERALNENNSVEAKRNIKDARMKFNWEKVVSKYEFIIIKDNDIKK